MRTAQTSHRQNIGFIQLRCRDLLWSSRLLSAAASAIEECRENSVTMAADAEAVRGQHAFTGMPNLRCVGSISRVCDLSGGSRHGRPYD